MTLGDVYWVEFAPRGGHAQSGRRPAIVLQNARASARLATVLVIPLTTQLDALRFPGTVLIEADSQNGLRRTSVALVFQLTAIDRRFLDDRIGKASPADLDQIFSALAEMTDPA